MKSPTLKVAKLPCRILACAALAFVLLPSLLTPLTTYAQGLAVPTAELPVAPVGAATIALELKDIADVAATALIKGAINLLRDQIITWIVTGRFGKPIFSRSFSLDLKKAAELASRNFLTQLSEINFCEGGPPIPSEAFFNLNLQLAVACQFNGNFLPFQQGRIADFISLSSSEQSANDYWNNTMTRLDRKLQEEARAKTSFAEEYRAGQGFLGTRDAVTGLINKPGSYVRDLVKEMKIVSPQRQADVANTVQQAITQIITTAIQASINRGLDAVFSEREAGGSGVQTAAPPAPPREPILQQIAAAIERARLFLDNVRPTAEVENVRGITAQQITRIENIRTSLTTLQTRLISATDGDDIRSIAANVDAREIELNAALSATRFCAVFDPASRWCPR